MSNQTNRTSGSGANPTQQQPQAAMGGGWIHKYTERVEQLPDGKYKRTIHHEYIAPNDVVVHDSAQDLASRCSSMQVVQEISEFNRLNGGGWQRAVNELLLEGQGNTELREGNGSGLLTTPASVFPPRNTHTDPSSSQNLFGSTKSSNGINVFSSSGPLRGQLVSHQTSLAPSGLRSGELGSFGCHTQSSGLFETVPMDKANNAPSHGSLQNGSISAGSLNSMPQLLQVSTSHQAQASTSPCSAYWQSSGQASVLPQSNAQSLVPTAQQADTGAQNPRENSCFEMAIGTLFPPYKADYVDRSLREHYDTITFQPGYWRHSVEELRVADYAQGRKKASGSGIPVVGFPSATAWQNSQKNTNVGSHNQISEPGASISALGGGFGGGSGPGGFASFTPVITNNTPGIFRFGSLNRNKNSVNPVAALSSTSGISGADQWASSWASGSGTTTAAIPNAASTAPSQNTLNESPIMTGEQAKHQDQPIFQVQLPGQSPGQKK